MALYIGHLAEFLPDKFNPTPSQWRAGSIQTYLASSSTGDTSDRTLLLLHACNDSPEVRASGRYEDLKPHRRPFIIRPPDNEEMLADFAGFFFYICYVKEIAVLHAIPAPSLYVPFFFSTGQRNSWLKLEPIRESRVCFLPLTVGQHFPTFL